VTERDDSARPHLKSCRLVYDVSVRAETRGRIVEVHFPRDTSTADLVGRVCWEAIYQRASPCVGCLAIEAQGAPLGVREQADDQGRTGFVVTRVEPVGEVARVEFFGIAPEVWRAVLLRHMHLVCERHGLSTQERVVLGEVLAGLQDKEIVEKLGISPRTVKFHVSNLMRKLGVARRLALLRMMLGSE